MEEGAWNDRTVDFSTFGMIRVCCSKWLDADPEPDFLVGLHMAKIKLEFPVTWEIMVVITV